MDKNIESIVTKTTNGSYSVSAALTGGAFFTFLEENSAAISVLCLLLGTVLGVGTFLVSWYYQHKRMKRER